MEIYIDRNQSTNSSFIIHGDNASPVYAAISMIFSAWIIISNLFILICLIKHRNTLIQSTFTLQILTLSASDFLVGLSTLTLYLTTFTKNVSYNICCFKIVITLSAQAVEQIHILGICITRLLIVAQMTSPKTISKNTGTVVIFLTINWIINVCIFSVPFWIWAKYRNTLVICSVNEIFQDNYKLYAIYASAIYAVTALTINAVYISMIVKLGLFSRKNTFLNSRNVKSKMYIEEQRLSPEFSSEGPIVMTNKFVAEQPYSQRLDILKSSYLNSNTDTKLRINAEPADDYRREGQMFARQDGTGEDAREENQKAETEPQAIRTISNQVSPIDGKDNHRTSTEYENDSWTKFNTATQSRKSNRPSFRSQSKALTTIGNYLHIYIDRSFSITY